MINIANFKKYRFQKNILICLASFLMFGASVCLLPNRAYAATPAAPCDAYLGNSGEAIWKKAAAGIIPIIPDGLLKDTEPITQGGAAGCGPAFWDLSVAQYFIFKGIFLLNWIALALSTILILYAGVLYISGFAVEANVKKAKSIIIATITGMAIVYSARYIVFGSIMLFSDESARKTINSPEAIIPNTN